MNLDDLDERLLESFAEAFPRPRQIPFCDYDIDRVEMLKLCTGARPYQNHNLMASFASHNRWGMFGDWRHFPSFAGDLAVAARRQGFDHEHDLVFYYMHTSACGLFSETLFPLIAEWAADILMPWGRAIAREDLFPSCEMHAIGYLAVYCNVGGDPAVIIRRNLNQSRSASSPTQLLRIIHDHFLLDSAPIYRHFSSARRSVDNQDLPSPDCRVVPTRHVDRIVAAIAESRIEITQLYGT